MHRLLPISTRTHSESQLSAVQHCLYTHEGLLPPMKVFYLPFYTDIVGEGLAFYTAESLQRAWGRKKWETHSISSLGMYTNTKCHSCKSIFLSNGPRPILSNTNHKSCHLVYTRHYKMALPTPPQPYRPIHSHSKNHLQKTAHLKWIMYFWSENTNYKLEYEADIVFLDRSLVGLVGAARPKTTDYY